MTNSKKAKLVAKFQKAFPNCWAKVGTEFDGGNAVIWSGEGSEHNGIRAFDMYAEVDYMMAELGHKVTKPTYEFGVHNDLVVWAERNDLYWEAYDNGTFLAYEI